MPSFCYLQVAFFSARAAAQVVAEVRDAKEHHDQKCPGDEQDPPRVGHQRLFREREHAAPGHDLDGQAEAHEAERRFGDDGAAHIHHHHEEDGREEIRRKVTPQNVEKAATHALRRDDVLARAQLLHLGTHDLGDTRPACESDDERDAPRARRADDCLQEDDKQQVRHTEENFGQAHQQRVEPFGRKSADRAEEDREQRRNDGRADADEQPAVPDHREDVAPHRVRAEQELAARRGRAVSQVEIRRVLRHDNTPKLSQTEKDDITMKENRKLLREVLKDIRRDMTDEEVLNLLADSKISENPAGEKEKYTLGQRAAGGMY